METNPSRNSRKHPVNTTWRARPCRGYWRHVENTRRTPRVLATWFHWTGEVVAMPTFLAAPHVRHAAGRLRALRANPDAAVTIDTETFPPEVVTIRGPVEISEVDGIPAEYESAARRYLGDEAAQAYLAQIDQPGTRMARIDLHPEWVGVLDFQSRLPDALGGIS